MYLSMLTVATAQAACDPMTIPELHEELAAAEAAFVAADEVTFFGAAARAVDGIPCLASPLEAPDAIRFHAVRAMVHSVSGQPDAALVAFRAVLELDPSWQMPDALVPAGHPLRSQVEQARSLVPPSSMQLPPPAEGWLVVDGKRTAAAPSDRPFLVQWLEGDVPRLSQLVITPPAVWGWPVAPAESQAELTPAPDPQPLVELPPIDHRAHRAATGWVLLGGGVGTAAAGAALYGATLSAWTRGSVGLVGADQSSYWTELAPRYYAGAGLLGAGAVVAATGLVVELRGRRGDAQERIEPRR